MREFLKGLDLDKETIDSIMAEYGKNVQGYKEAKEEAESKLKSYEENSKEQNDWKSKFEELDEKIKKQEADKKSQEEDEMLTKNIAEALGDRKFASEYAEKGVLSDVKAELNKPENKGRGVKEIVDSLTKDKEGIFENPNKPADMAPMGKGNDNSTDNNANGFVSIVKEFQRK
jgi:hypothetical protein